ncbi:cytochrome C [Belliella kenyensis]|uniref:Cytochrome C n=1 Tax=Belliella kenyensis TaxID=1472724 RepID=A0ABV8EHZ6_9BACT|nr:cytochrome C [Belliella kenyensis]MCH7402786.1 cytochrome C [Belliella kenyensis]MDN3603665.1 cytochrome C [Belliella kenyensis]
MEEQDLRKSLRFIFILGSLAVLLVLSMIVGTMLIQQHPEWLLALKENHSSKNSTSNQQENEPNEEVEWTPEALEEVGLVEGEGLQLVLTHCTNCHSAKLITQNRFTKEGWIQVIRWMQSTQGLWELGDAEAEIVTYLSKHFAPEARGRRAPLEVEWYDL